MAVTLPAQFTLTPSSTVTEETGVAVDKTDDGANALRDLYPKSYFDLQAEFTEMHMDNYPALLTFLRTNRLFEIDILLDGITYRMTITKPPVTKFVGGLYRQASASFRGYIL